MEMVGMYCDRVFKTLKEAYSTVDEEAGETIFRVFRDVLPGETVYDGFGPVIAPTESDYRSTYDLYEIEPKTGRGRFLWVRHHERWMIKANERKLR